MTKLKMKTETCHGNGNTELWLGTTLKICLNNSLKFIIIKAFYKRPYLKNGLELVGSKSFKVYFVK